MANTTIYVNTDSSGGTNGSTNASGVAFPTLDAALTYTGANKVAGDVWSIVVSAPSGVIDNPLSLTLGGYGISTNATGILYIRPNRGNEGGTVADQRHKGIWSTAIYRLGVRNGLTLSLQYTRIVGLQIFGLGNGNNPPSGPNITADNNYVERCLIVADPTYAGTGASGANIGINVAGGLSGTRLFNDVIVGFNIATAYVPGLGLLFTGGGKYFNLSIIDCRNGTFFSNVATGKNILINGSVVSDWAGSGWNYATIDYCASEDATAPGTHNRINQTFSFASPGSPNFNYILQSGDVGAKGFGTDLSADDWTDVSGSACGPSIDIRDVARSGTWSIGASEAPSGGGGSIHNKFTGKFGGKFIGKIV